MKKTLLILGCGLLVLSSCKKTEDNFLQKSILEDEITPVDGEMMAEIGQDAEGMIFITSQTSARAHEYLGEDPAYNLTGNVRQSINSWTMIDAGTLYIGSLTYPAQNYNGSMAYASLGDPDLGGYFGTNAEISLSTATAQIFADVLEFPAELFISAPLTDPESTPFSNEVTDEDVLTWNTDIKNTHDVLVEITDLSQATAGPARYLTPDDGSLDFADLWAYLPEGAFEITLQRGNWTSFAGADSRDYRFIVWTSSSVVYTKSSN